MNTPTQTIGRGILSISRTLASYMLPDLFHIEDCTLQGELKTQGIFEQVHGVLMLPDSYSVVGIFYSEWMLHQSSMWMIIVESSDIPQVDKRETLPMITPIYTRHEDGSNSLVRIDISK